MRHSTSYFAALLFCATASVFGEPPVSGFVTGSLLRCRAQPDVNAPVVGEFRFGTPLLLGGTPKVAVVDGIRDAWYQEATHSCWVFAGYVLKSPHRYSGYLKSQVYAHNMVCGGFTCGSNFTAILINDFYAAPVYFDDYCMDADQPCTGIIIGRYERTANGIEFGLPLHVGTYSSKRAFRAGTHAEFAQNNFYGNWLLNRILHKGQDAEGLYYANSYYIQTPRSEARIPPADRAPRDGPKGVYYIETLLDIPALHKLFKIP